MAVVVLNSEYLWDDQEVHRRLLADVPEGEGLVILIDHIRGNFPGDDLVEDCRPGR